MMTNKFKFYIIKEVITDPGVAYTVGDTILFASLHSVVGFVACFAAVVVSVVSKTLAVSDTEFARKHSRFAKIFLDPKTPLRACATSMFVVGAVALLGGAWIPAAAGFLWGVGALRIAHSIEDAKRAKDKKVIPDGQNKEKKKQSAFRRTMLLLAKRPDIWLCSGNAAAALMVGAAAIWMFPIIALAGAVAFRNAVQNKPEYVGHPKIIVGLIGAFNFAVGIVNGNWLPAAANVVYASVAVNIECRITPGGGCQILRDVRGRFANIFGGSFE